MARLGRSQPFAPLIRRARIFGADVTVALAGVAATCAVGTVGVALGLALSGGAGTASAGSVGVSTTPALTGVAATGSVGGVTQSRTVPMTGASATGSVGTVSTGSDVTTALTGVSGTSAVGTMAPSRSMPISGTAATGSLGSLTQSSSVPISGAQVAGAVGVLTPSTGGAVTLAITGVSATGSVGSVGSTGGEALSDASAVDAAIIAALLADAQLTALMPHGVYMDLAPPDRTRFVLVTMVTHEDDYVFEGSAWEQFSYLVKAVSKATSGNTSGSDVKAAAARIHNVLQDRPLTIAGYDHMLTRRSERIRYTEVDDVDKDTRWNHRGGRYDVFVSPV